MEQNSSTEKEINSKPNVKQRKNSQKYRHEWAVQFLWIDRSSDSEYKYYCKVCKESFAVSIKDAKRHSITSKHKDRSERIEKENIVESLIDFTRAVKEAKLHLVAYIVEHNLPFSAIEYLPHLIRTVENDINVVNAIKINRTKCSAIVNNVFGTCSFNSLVKQLQKSQFSLMIDEFTDIGSIKHLACCMRSRRR